MMDLVINDQGFGNSKTIIPWTDLRALGIRTTAGGPHFEDVFWVFLLQGGTIEIPGSEMTSSRLAELQARLPGFDNAKVVAAMGSIQDRMYRVWHQDAARAGWHLPTHRERFRRLVERLGGDPSRADEAFQALFTAWGEDHRRYHRVEHLAECLHELDVASQGQAPSPVAELALWYHDAHYVPGAHDNEERSAEWLLEDRSRLRLPLDVVQGAAAAVRATAHGTEVDGLSPDARLVVDADLAILAADPLRFLEYDYAIEEEHPRVPALRFRIGRGRFLTQLLARPRLFHSNSFGERYEAKAREQVAALLASDRYRAFRVAQWLTRPFRALAA